MSSVLEYQRLNTQEESGKYDHQDESTSFLEGDPTNVHIDTTKSHRRLHWLILNTAVILGALLSSLITLLIVRTQNRCSPQSNEDLWCESSAGSNNCGNRSSADQYSPRTARGRVLQFEH
jgi:hypothetical protein